MKTAVLGIGECMIQFDASGAGGLEQSEAFHAAIGGDVFNTLAGLTSCGHTAQFMSQVGQDAFGQRLMQAFDRFGVGQAFVNTHPKAKNGIYFTSFNSAGRHEFVYYRSGSAASRMTPDDLSESMIKSAQIVYATGVTQGISPTCRALVLKAFKLAKIYGVTVAYDPNYRAALWNTRADALEAFTEVLPYVDILLPSSEDISQLLDITQMNVAMDYLADREVPIIAIKQGQEGALLGFQHQKQTFPILSEGAVVDTVGAGDAFNAGFLSGILEELSLSECIERGQALAAKSIAARGPISYCG